MDCFPFSFVTWKDTFGISFDDSIVKNRIDESFKIEIRKIYFFNLIQIILENNLYNIFMKFVNLSFKITSENVFKIRLWFKRTLQCIIINISNKINKSNKMHKYTYA